MSPSCTNITPMRELVADPRTNITSCPMCELGTRNLERLRVKRPTCWLSTAPEIIDRLQTRCSHSRHGRIASSRDVRAAARMPREVAKRIMLGFRCSLNRTDPGRLKELARSLDLRIRGAGQFADRSMVELAAYCANHCRDHEVHVAGKKVIIDENTEIPEAGIEFEVPAESQKLMTKSLLSAVRRKRAGRSIFWD